MRRGNWSREARMSPSFRCNSGRRVPLGWLTERHCDGEQRACNVTEALLAVAKRVRKARPVVLPEPPDEEAA